MPHLGPATPRRESALARATGKAMLAALGWRIEGEIPNLPKFVIAVAPHTSNWDFVVGAAAMFALDLRLAWIGKHTIFRWPFAGLLAWMGGIPVDRSRPHGFVAAAVSAFADDQPRVLGIAPEGTRKRVERFHVGFLHVARGAHVPVLLAALDYEARVVRMGPLIEPGDDVEADRARIESYFAPIRGRNR
jgi:1-acyl-sn-glycerol-3-phosphate acyltransferase